MGNWLNYKGLLVPNAMPDNDAGVNLKDDLMLLADRFGPLYANVVTREALPSNTYDNGADGVGATLTATAVGELYVDSYGVQEGDVVVVNLEPTQANNGLYVVTSSGSSTEPFVLTRHPGLCTEDQFGAGALVVVGNAGSTILNTVLSCQPVNPITVGTSAIVFGWSESGGRVGAAFSHAEGDLSSANGKFSHAEGLQSTASGYYSHAEGEFSTASGDYSHAEGSFAQALVAGSHAEGAFYCTASGYFSHAEGLQTSASP